MSLWTDYIIHVVRLKRNSQYLRYWWHLKCTSRYCYFCNSKNSAICNLTGSILESLQKDLGPRFQLSPQIQELCHWAVPPTIREVIFWILLSWMHKAQRWNKGRTMNHTIKSCIKIIYAVIWNFPTAHWAWMISWMRRVRIEKYHLCISRCLAPCM